MILSGHAYREWRSKGRSIPREPATALRPGAVLALCAGATLPEAALVGNLVASITIQQIGTTGVAQPLQLQEAFSRWASASGEA